MDEYLKNMEDYSPNDIGATGVSMHMKPITIVESLPLQTAVTDDDTINREVNVPKYKAPKKIEVKRYILKK